MMKMKNKNNGEDEQIAADWEMRPGGMLVQKRNPDSDHNSVPPPALRVRVKYGSTYTEIRISPQSTFGELKKMLMGPTGLHHEDQKLMFKGKERDSKAFLDISGVKDRSKIVLIEDPISQEKRYIEMRKRAKMEKASKTISDISLEVDRLAGQVSALESVISKGGKVAEKNVINLIELLMNNLVKLDNILGDGDVKLQKKLQVNRIQQCVETLDVLKIESSMNTSNGNEVKQRSSSRHRKPEAQKQRLSPIHEPKPRNSTSKEAVIVTTQWETFDSTPLFLPVNSLPTKPISGVKKPDDFRFDWDLLR